VTHLQEVLVNSQIDRLHIRVLYGEAELLGHNLFAIVLQNIGERPIESGDASPMMLAGNQIDTQTQFDTKN
jgi:hypothetical protein